MGAMRATCISCGHVTILPASFPHTQQAATAPATFGSWRPTPPMPRRRQRRSKPMPRRRQPRSRQPVVVQGRRARHNGTRDPGSDRSAAAAAAAAAAARGVPVRWSSHAKPHSCCCRVPGALPHLHALPACWPPQLWHTPSLIAHTHPPTYPAAAAVAATWAASLCLPPPLPSASSTSTLPVPATRTLPLFPPHQDTPFRFILKGTCRHSDDGTACHLSAQPGLNPCPLCTSPVCSP